MSIVTSTPNTNPVDTSKTSAATTSLTGDFNLFLKLLTTQMQNQDPMNPMDSSQYTQQLVQYSQVEQSIQQNKTLNSILSNLTGQSLTQGSSMIGKQVEVTSDTAGLTAASPAQWNWTSPVNLTGLTATMLDGKNVKIDTRDVTVNGTSGTFSWDGKTAAGTTAPDGAYKLVLQGTDANGKTVKLTPTVVGTVANVQMINGQALVTINGAQYDTSGITRVGQ